MTSERSLLLLTLLPWLTVRLGVLPAAGQETAAGRPLAVLEGREQIGRDWPETLVTYYLVAPGEAPPRADAAAPRAAWGQPPAASPAYVRLAAPVPPGELRVVEEPGRERLAQLSRVRTDAAGNLRSACLSFRAGLPKLGAYRYTLRAGAPTPSPSDLRVSEGEAYLTLENRATAVRLPRAGSFTFPELRRFGADPAAPGLAPGPLQGFRLADGQWVGGSYLYAPDPERAPRITGYTCAVTESGPLFVEARISYRFDRPDWFYQVTVRLEAGDPVVQIDEQYDTGLTRTGNMHAYAERNYNNDPRLPDVPDPEDTLKLVVSLTGRGRAEGWRPDLAYGIYPGSQAVPGRVMDREQRFADLGFPVPEEAERSVCSRPVPAPGAAQQLFSLAAWSPWYNVHRAVGLVDTARLTPGAAPERVPFVGIIPVHPGNWRGAHADFIANRLRARADGDVTMEWPLRVEPHPNSHLDSGEYDPDLPFSFGRRQWLLVTGPVQYYDGLRRLRMQRGHISLDDYKDWLLEWPEDPQVVYPRLGMSAAQVTAVRPRLAQHPGRAALEQMLYFQSPPDEKRKQELLGYRNQINGTTQQVLDNLMSGFVRTGAATAYVHLDELFAAGVTPEQRRDLRAQIAAACYANTEPDEAPRGSMMLLGNPNMPTNRFFILPLAAALIPDHPLAAYWMEMSRQYVRFQLARNTDPAGTWSEGMHYQPVGYVPVLHGAYALQVNGRLDDSLARLAALPTQYMLRLMSPPDPRMAKWERWYQDKEPHGPVRAVQGWGHDQLYSYLHWLEAASVVRQADPAMARSLAWAWDQVGRPLGSYYETHANQMAGFTARVAVNADLVNTIPPGYVPPELDSVWLPGLGVNMRAHPGDPGETFVSCRMGYFHSHCDWSHGDFVFYAQGAPLVSMSSRVYVVRATAPEVKALHDSFGWPSNVRFGARSNYGEWPGGVPTAGVHAHYFSDGVDYARGLGDFSPQRWTRQLLLLKGATGASPTYLVLRDGFAPLPGAAGELEPTWWYLKNPGPADSVVPQEGGLEFTSPYGPKLTVRLLEPPAPVLETREAADVGRNIADANPDLHLFQVTAVGPNAPGQPILAVLYPRAAAAPPPLCERLADNAAKITTPEGTDYLFLDQQPMQFRNEEVAFEGVAGVLRLRGDAVEFTLAEGPGRLVYQGLAVQGESAGTLTVPRDRLRPGTVTLPDSRQALSGPQLELSGATSWQPGVTRGALPNGFAVVVDSPTPVRVARDGVSFEGRRGAVLVDRRAGTVRVVMQDGTRAGYREAQLFSYSSPGAYDVTVYPDRIAGRSVGGGGLLYAAMPPGLYRHITLVVDDQTFAPGTHQREVIVPLMPGAHRFEVRDLAQPVVPRNWQAW